ncbi:related to 54S ribosomal protein L32, mitochondrial [Saccharomycodes ludwigii]|uniref:Large ribosomal subunit protein bL32m n=1 Tax=Saccharomycodes ludwigii TaxID=36035 RepID=A0A376B5E5_9ASCO|nr:hypothetical protein SCDLUD_003435 [Saccharomycodes ludwigii]KAH3900453.1 hypothetical protein SCDLUD_003435 [Saccharomycodes ludwigii]SSD59916.1 related to 54S ribosomal protein L32, mitochondrial [Saccharomycodes ludwigii]
MCISHTTTMCCNNAIAVLKKQQQQPRNFFLLALRSILSLGGGGTISNNTIPLGKWAELVGFPAVNNDTNSESVTDFLTDNGILLAAPKKKVSHQKKRQKAIAPARKQLKFIHHLNNCPSCGHYKRANTICMYCFGSVRHLWKSFTRKELKEPIQEQELSDLDKKIIYPGRKETDYTKKLKDKDSYLERRMRTLPVEGKE